MEAKGHEELSKELKEILKQFFKSKGVEYEPEALYMGNWFSDYSQLLDEGPKSKIYNLIIFPNKIVNILESFKNKLSGEIGKKNKITAHFHNIMEEEIAKDYPNVVRVNKIVQRILPVGITKSLYSTSKEYRNEIGNFEKINNHLSDCLDVAIKLIKPTIIQKNPIQFNDINSIETNEILKNIEKSLFLTVKLLAYRKFVLYNNQSIDFHEFNKITNSLLKGYKPHEHLDRFFNLFTEDKEEKKLLVKNENDFNSNFSNLIYNDFQTDEAKTLFKKNKIRNEVEELDKIKDILTIEEYEKALEEIKKKESTSIKLYGYLEEYLLIACGHLAELEIYFNNVSKDQNDVNIQLARLGKVLHVFEDFFAHSNYIDFNNLLLFQASKDIRTKDNRVKKYLEINNYSNIEMNKSIRSLVKVDEHIDKKKQTGFIDNKISTGYFGSEDIKVSLYHIMIGLVNEISDLDSSEDLTSEENLSKIVDKTFLEDIREKEKLIDSVKSIDQLENKKNKITSNYEKEVNKIKLSKNPSKRIKYNSEKNILDENFKKQIETIDELLSLNKRIAQLNQYQVSKIKSQNLDIPTILNKDEIKKLFASKDQSIVEDEVVLDYLQNVINTLIYSKYLSLRVDYLKNKFKLVKELAKIIEFIKTIIRIVFILISYPTAILRIVKLFLDPLKKVLWEKAKTALKESAIYYVEKSIVKLLEMFIQPSLSEFRSGSHSLMAKDEEYEKKELHKKATNMASVMDKLILKNLFTSNKDNVISKLNPTTNILNYNGIEYIMPAELANKTIMEKYEYLSEKHPELNDEIYVDWYNFSSILCYNYGAPILLGEKIPNFKLENLDLKDKYSFSNLKINDNLEAQVKIKRKFSNFNNKLKFDNSTKSVNFNSENIKSTVNKIRIVEENILDQIEITDSFLNNNHMKIMLNDYLNIDLPYFIEKTNILDAQNEFIYQTKVIENKISENFRLSNIILNYFPKSINN